MVEQSGGGLGDGGGGAGGPSSRAEALRLKANAHFRARKFCAALRGYTEAISLSPGEAVLYSNRCACYLELKEYALALHDANRCVALRPGWAKGWARKGAALGRLQELQKARVALQKAVELEPTNDAYHKMLDGLQSMVEATGRLRERFCVPAVEAPMEKLIKKYGRENLPAALESSSAKMRLYTVEFLVVKALQTFNLVLARAKHLGPHPTPAEIEELNREVMSVLEGVSNAILTDYSLVTLDAERLVKFQGLLTLAKHASGWVEDDYDYCRSASVDVLRYRKYMQGHLPEGAPKPERPWNFTRMRIIGDVRLSIIYGYLMISQAEFAKAEKAIHRAVSLIELCREEFQSCRTSEDTCNLLDTESFLRAVKVFLMNLLAMRYTTSADKTLSQVERIKALAEDVILSASENPMTDSFSMSRPEFVFQFLHRHFACAHSCMGLYYNHNDNLEPEEEKRKKRSLAGKHYLHAALHYCPQDDPNFALYAYIGAEALLMSDTVVSLRTIRAIARDAQASEATSCEIFPEVNTLAAKKLVLHLLQRKDIPDEAGVDIGQDHIDDAPGSRVVDEDVSKILAAFADEHPNIPMMKDLAGAPC